jgi:hypothetical protein
MGLVAKATEIEELRLRASSKPRMHGFRDWIRREGAAVNPNPEAKQRAPAPALAECWLNLANRISAKRKVLL